jgi:hypothetical protein
MRSRKKLLVLSAAVCAGAVAAAPLLDSADARRPKTKTLVGTYRGTTEEGGTVSFKVTPSRRVVGFTLTKATLYCLTDKHRGSVIPTREPEYTKPLAKIAHLGPIPMKKVSKRNPQGKEFELREPAPENMARQTGIFTGRIEDLLKVTRAGPIVLPEKGFVGEVEFETANGPTPFPSSANPTPEWAPGTEWCVTKPIDWRAKKPGSPGYVP